MKRRQALEELDHDVADDGIADDDVGEVVDEVLALDVADEVQAGRDRAARCAGRSGLALATLLADRQQGDSGPSTPRTRSAKMAPMCGVLVEVLTARVGVGADVEEDEGPRLRDHLDRQCGPVDARQAAQPQDRGGHAGTRVTGGHDSVGLAAPDEIGSDEDRGVLLLAQGEGRVLVHLDDLARRGRSSTFGLGNAEPAIFTIVARSPTRITSSPGCSAA